MTLREKCIAIAVGVFVCDDPDMTTLDQYNVLVNEDGSEFASNAVTVWEPFDQFTCEDLVNQIDTLADSIEDLVKNHPRDLKRNIYKNQINKLADFIMNEVEGEPSQDEGVVDCAIRIIKEAKNDKRREAENIH